MPISVNSACRFCRQSFQIFENAVLEGSFGKEIVITQDVFWKKRACRSSHRMCVSLGARAKSGKMEKWVKSISILFFFFSKHGLLNCAILVYGQEKELVLKLFQMVLKGDKTFFYCLGHFENFASGKNANWCTFRTVIDTDIEVLFNVYLERKFQDAWRHSTPRIVRESVVLTTLFHFLSRVYCFFRLFFSGKH